MSDEFRWGEWEDIAGSENDLVWEVGRKAHVRLNECMAVMNFLRESLPDAHLRSVVDQIRGELYEAGSKLVRASNAHPDSWPLLKDPVERLVNVTEALTDEFQGIWCRRGTAP